MPYAIYLFRAATLRHPLVTGLAAVCLFLLLFSESFAKSSGQATARDGGGDYRRISAPPLFTSDVRTEEWKRRFAKTAACPLPPRRHKAGDACRRLFGTVEFRGVFTDLPKWMRVLREEKRRPSFLPDGLGCKESEAAPRWRQLQASLEGVSDREKINKVNAFFNQWPYLSDALVWGVEDYWPTACEFIRRSGDCTGFAIAKYYALRHLGLPAERLRLAALSNVMTGKGHAALVVYLDGEALVLDTVTSEALPHTRLTHYRPLYTVNEEHMWRHVRPVGGQ
jgi:predicted transglutaminase-like cysteine proteinase